MKKLALAALLTLGACTPTAQWSGDPNSYLEVKTKPEMIKVSPELGDVIAGHVEQMHKYGIMFKSADMLRARTYQLENSEILGETMKRLYRMPEDFCDDVRVIVYTIPASRPELAQGKPGSLIGFVHDGSLHSVPEITDDFSNLHNFRKTGQVHPARICGDSLITSGLPAQFGYYEGKKEIKGNISTRLHIDEKPFGRYSLDGTRYDIFLSVDKPNGFRPR